MLRRSAGRAVLVTGASSGIGRAIALAVRARGRGRRDHVSRERKRRARRRARDRARSAAAPSSAHSISRTKASIRALGPAARQCARPPRRLGQQRRRRHPHRRRRGAAADREARPAARRGSARHDAGVVAGGGAPGRAGDGGVIINMSWDHVLTGMAGRESADVLGGEGRRAGVQQVARALASRRACASTCSRPAGSRRRSARARRDGCARRSPSRTPLEALGHARGRGRRRGVSGVAGRRVHHRPDDPGRRRRRDVNVEHSVRRSGNVAMIAMATKNRPTTKRRSPRSCASCPAGTSKTDGSAASTRPTAGRRR